MGVPAVIRALASGRLITDPQLRQGAKGPFVTGLMSTGYGDDALLCNLIAFGSTADQFGSLRKGASLSVTGRADARAWTDRAGDVKASIGIVVDELITLKSKTAGDSVRERQPHKAYAGRRPPQPEGDGRPFDDGLPPW